MVVYLHVPFQVPPSRADESAFATAVVREIERSAPIADAPLRTLYVGGGRPALLSVSALQTIVEALHAHLGSAAGWEATVELHPANASRPFLAALREQGFTRLSIDARPLADAELRPPLHLAHEAGFDRLSLDLAFGGPEQSHAAWKTRLHRAVDLRVPHVALHERAPEEGTSNERERSDRFAFAMTVLPAKGYEQYELTHFARPGHRSQYQTHVYAHGDVLGLGPSAESFRWPDRSDPSTAERWSNVPDLATYVKRLHNDASPVAQHEALDRPALAREYILLRLRTSDGLDLSVLDDRYGVSLRARRASTLDRLTEEGLLHDDPDRVRLTPRGRLLTDAITQRLIREA
ncbi:MAG: coproporphyrinogen-III oxidase family protein [Salinibacter sp.]